MIRSVAACLLAASCAAPAWSEDGSSALELAIVSGDEVVRAQLEIDASGKSYQEIWEAKFAAIYAFCDVDQDDALSEQECRRLPSVRALRESITSGFAPVIGEPPTLGQLDAGGDGKVTLAELAAYYRSSGLGAPALGIGAAPFSAELTTSLLERLDQDRDGRVTEAEWRQAEKILPSLDQNDDELLGAGELVAGIFYPGASGNLLRGAPRAGERPLPDALATFPIVVLPSDRQDMAWAKAVAALRSSGEDATAGKDLVAWRDQPAETLWRMAIDASPQAAWTINRIEAQPTAGADLLRWQIGKTWVTLRTEAGRLEKYAQGIRDNVTKRFAAADQDQDGRLTKAEGNAERGGFGAAMIAVLDADQDEVVTQAELDAWLKMQREIGANQVMITAIDCGPGLFELLDFDRNGALSRRELRDAWSRIEAAGAVEAGAIKAELLPRQLLLTASLGQPTSPLGKIERSGPAWFLAMDRNGDGDVSRREFVGPASAFGSLDRSGDELISADEVEGAR